MKSLEKSPSLESKKSHAIVAYIERIIAKYPGAGEEREEELKRIWSGKTAKEKADELYDAMLTFRLFDKQRAETKKASEAEQVEMEESGPSPRLISRIKVLSSDEDVVKILPETYGKARVEHGKIRASSIVQNWNKLEESIHLKEGLLWKKEGSLIQGGAGDATETKELASEVQELEEIISDNRETQVRLEALVDMPKTAENTDAIALLRYERFNQYRAELDKGFVWLPSRLEALDGAMRVLREGDPKQTKKGVWFISEPGTGKTELIRAISKKLTHQDRVKISCGPRTGEKQFEGQQKVFPGATTPDEATYHELRRSITAAWTGYDHTYDAERVRDRAQVVELDEFPKLFSNDVAFAHVKDLFSLRDGDELNGKPVLPGRMLFASGNVGAHHGNIQIPPALDRHFKVIPVDYPEMSTDNPELYEFMVAALMEKGGLPAKKEEIAPGYARRDFLEDEKYELEDGSVVVGVEDIISDPTSKKHGYLYRLAHAVKAVQDAYMARGGENEFIDYTDRPRLLMKTDQDGNEYVSDTGNPEVLNSTITLQDLSGWMNTYKSQLVRKQNMSLTHWLQEKINEKIEDKHVDQGKLRAIFNHFHLLDEDQGVSGEAKPFTPKEIGYLSPRVPRPVEVEKPIVEEAVAEPGTEGKPAGGPIEKYTTREITLLDGTVVYMEDSEFELAGGAFDPETKELVNLTVPVGEKFMIERQEYVYSGNVDKNSGDNVRLIGKISEEDLYQQFSVEELKGGLIEYFKFAYENDFSDFKEEVIDCWEDECAGEKAPQWD